MFKRPLSVAVLIATCSGAAAQGVGQLGPNQIWGNPTASGAPSRPSNIGSFLTPGPGISISGAPKATIGITNSITAAGPMGSATQTIVLTFNAQGKITAATLATIAPPFTAITGALACSQEPALTGSVTTTVGSCATTIATGVVTFANLASSALASNANVISGASSVVVTPNVIYQSETTTTFSATPTFDFSTFINTAITLTGNITTMNVANVKAGQAGSITFIQDSTGSRTTVFNSIFKFAGGLAPTLSTTASAIDVLFYSCRSSTVCPASLVQNMK
jgi:hypothetical protein